jgi:hypothetical protein
MNISDTLRLFLLIITNAGGEGKTFVVLLLKAIFELLREQELSLDTDSGNKALSSVADDARFLDPLAEPAQSKLKIKNQLSPEKSLLIDAGANMQSVSRQFEDMCRDVGEELEEQGYLVQALWMVSTNKLAAAGSVTRAAKRINPPFATCFVFNDRDGSGLIPEEIKPDITVGHLHPGLVSIVNQRGGFAAVIKDGKPDYRHSVDMIAKFVWDFANQDGMRKIFGNNRIEQLKLQLDRQTLNISPFTLKTSRNDKSMEHLAKKAHLMRKIDPYFDDIDAMIEVLKRYKTN